jgi:hypothetical protein
MNLGENRIEMRIPRSAWFLAIYVSRIPKPFLIEFITASRLRRGGGRWYGSAIWPRIKGHVAETHAPVGDR